MFPGEPLSRMQTVESIAQMFECLHIKGSGITVASHSPDPHVSHCAYIELTDPLQKHIHPMRKDGLNCA